MPLPCPAFAGFVTAVCRDASPTFARLAAGAAPSSSRERFAVSGIVTFGAAIAYDERCGCVCFGDCAHQAQRHAARHDHRASACATAAPYASRRSRKPARTKTRGSTLVVYTGSSRVVPAPLQRDGSPSIASSCLAAARPAHPCLCRAETHV